MAEKAFVAFLECDTTPSQSDPEACCSAAAASVQPSGSAHLPIGAAASVTQAIEAISTAADAATAPALEACHAQLDSYDQSASTSSHPFFPLHPPPSFPVDGPQGIHSADMRSSPDATAARAWAQPPVELTVKHVGFLGSLAHALVHLQKASEGLSLLRAAACIMRTNPPAFHMWFQGSPDPQVLHAHVLMDLVSFANPATTSLQTNSVCTSVHMCCLATRSFQETASAKQSKLWVTVLLDFPAHHRNLNEIDSCCRWQQEVQRMPSCYHLLCFYFWC